MGPRLGKMPTESPPGMHDHLLRLSQRQIPKEMGKVTNLPLLGVEQGEKGLVLQCLPQNQSRRVTKVTPVIRRRVKEKVGQRNHHSQRQNQDGHLPKAAPKGPAEKVTSPCLFYGMEDAIGVTVVRSHED